MKNKHSKIIIILSILLVISGIALTLITKEKNTKSTYTNIPANIITSENKEYEEANTRTSNSENKAKNIILHKKQQQDNETFKATNLFPGDNEKNYYAIKVFHNKDITVRFHADIRPGYEKIYEVLKIKVTLIDSNEILYDGLLKDIPNSLNTKLETEESTESDLYYEINVYLDTSVGNEYQNQSLTVDFNWWVEEGDYLDPPQTGIIDNISHNILLYIVIIILIIFLIFKVKKEVNKNN